MNTWTLDALAAELGGVVVGDGSTTIHGVAGIREAQRGDITFLANSRYDGYLAETLASAVICSREHDHAPLPLLQVDNPYLAFQKVVALMRPELARPLPGVHPTAVVSPDAVVAEGASIGAHCVVEAGARVGARAVLMPGCFVGVRAAIGDDTLLYPRVTVREECEIGSRCILHPGVVIGAAGLGRGATTTHATAANPAAGATLGRGGAASQRGSSTAVARDRADVVVGFGTGREEQEGCRCQKACDSLHVEHLNWLCVRHVEMVSFFRLV